MRNWILLMGIMLLLPGCSSESHSESANLPGLPGTIGGLELKVRMDPPDGYSYQVPTTFGSHSGPHMILTEFPGFLVGANLIRSGSSKSHSIGAKQVAVRGLIQRLDGDGKVIDSYECDGRSIAGLAHVYGSYNFLMSGGKTVGGQPGQSGFVAYLEGEYSIRWEIVFPEMSTVHDVDSNSDGYVGIGTASHASKVFRISLEGNLLWEVSLFNGEGETAEGFPYTQTAEAGAVRLCEDGTVLTVSRIYRSVTQPTGEIIEEGFGVTRIGSAGKVQFTKEILMPSTGILCVPVDIEEWPGTYEVLTDQLDSSVEFYSYHTVEYSLDASGDIISASTIAASSHGIYSAGGLLNGHGECNPYVGISIQDGTSTDGIPISNLHWRGLHSSNEAGVQNMGVDNIPLSLCPDGVGGPLAFGLFCDGPTADFPEGRYGAFLMTLM